MEKAQGSLEYLLLIGGAVLIAVIVVTFLLSVSEEAGGTVETSMDYYKGITTGSIVCDGKAEIGNPVVIASGSSSNQQVTINDTKTIRQVTLRQISPPNHFTQTYNVSINDSSIGSIPDDASNTANLVLGTSGPTVTDSFDFKVEITTPGPLEVEFASVIVLCNP